jgi:UDP-N-acetylmuramoylalanine--D-glutamate ligase
MFDPLKGKRVVVVGFGRQGQALARWLPSVGAETVVTDGKNASAFEFDRADYPGVRFVFGGHPDYLLDGTDLICVSGGVPLDLPFLVEARARRIPLSNDAELFLERCPAPVIGITGSAGKTTTTTLVGEIVRKAGYKTWVGGNIGTVLIEALPKLRPTDRVVMELSSFQLELMRVSPEIAAVLNITPNHLDRHGTMEAYTEAKAQILLHQHAGGETMDTAVLNRDDAGSRALAERAVGRVVWFSSREIVTDGAFLAGQRIVLSGFVSPDRQPLVIGERAEIVLRGDHNVSNVLAACAITGAAGIKPDVMMAAVREFKGVAHRLEVLRQIDGVTWINDSIATAPERVTAALRSFDEPLILLLGGRDKKLPWEEMLALALLKARQIIAFGEAAAMIAATARALAGDVAQVVEAAGLEEAVLAAAAAAQPGDVVLLSPGGTSYDAYSDFAERGEHFRALVERL